MKRIAVVMSGAVGLLAAGCAAAVVGTPLVAPVSPTTVELTAEPVVDELVSAVSVEPAVDALVSDDVEPVQVESDEFLGEVSDSPGSVTTVQSVAINGGHTVAAGSDALDRPATWGDLGTSDIADVWTYLEEQGLEPVAVTTTTTTVPVPTTTAPTPAPAPAPAPTPTPAPEPAPAPAQAREIRIQCPSGELLVLDSMPSMEEARELCGMRSSGSNGSASTRITCADGSTHTFDRTLTSAERDEVCAGRFAPAPTTTTTIPAPRVVRVDATYQGGAWGGSGFGVATEENCPMVAEISYSIHFDNGSVQTGNVSVPVDSSREVAGVRFIYRGPGGLEGCGRSLAYG